MNLKKYKDKLRLLVIYTDSYSNKDYIETKNKYKKHIKRFHKRYVKLITYKKSSNKFSIKLVGFDNKVKKTYSKLNVKNVLDDIERMPMGYLRNNKDKLVNLSLYEDYNPKTTIKNLGFKNKEKAIYTIDKIKNKDMKYQKNVVITMYNRAKYHPHRNKDMEEAMKVFKIWLNKNK